MAEPRLQIDVRMDRMEEAIMMLGSEVLDEEEMERLEEMLQRERDASQEPGAA